MLGYVCVRALVLSRDVYEREREREMQQDTGLFSLDSTFSAEMFTIQLKTCVCLVPLCNTVVAVVVVVVVVVVDIVVDVADILFVVVDVLVVVVVVVVIVVVEVFFLRISKFIQLLCSFYHTCACACVWVYVFVWVLVRRNMCVCEKVLRRRVPSDHMCVCACVFGGATVSHFKHIPRF